MAGFAELGGWPGVFSRIFSRDDLQADEADAVFGEILEGRAEPSQIAAFAAALRTKGETVAEMTGFVAAMRRHGESVEIGDAGAAVDTCGTGGDRSGTINVSTVASCVVAGAGAPVVKHGNRAASSRSGSADVLEALGVVVDLGPAGVARCVAEAGFGFCFAPRFHPALRHAAPVRRELGVATVFNFLGPLANPARVGRQVVGVGDPAMAEKMLGVLEANGVRHAMVLYGHDGLDELSTVAASTVLESYLDGAGARVRRVVEVDARALGLARASADDLRGGDAAENAGRSLAILSGERGPQRDLVVLNAAAGLVVAGLAPDLEGGLKLAEETLDSGAAREVLERLVEASRRAAADGLS